MFLKAPLVPKYTNFEGGARAEKRDFLVKFFEVEKKVACGEEILDKMGHF